MTTSSSSKDNFFQKVINPYLPEVMKHPQTIEMHEGVLHIPDVQWSKKEGSEKGRHVAVEQEIFKFQGMMVRRLSANNSMITDAIRKNKKDNNEIVEMTFKLHDMLQHYCGMLLTRHYNQRPFDETVCDPLIANDDVINHQKRFKNVWDGGDSKDDSDCSCMCDVWHTVHSNE
ncbi:hypothetical protein D1007_06660 [Hordeum vulgare]|nr:hypothetical protein D1007_06660 [Hordeum vulgare]